jgi:hypothetical protein
MCEAILEPIFTIKETIVIPPSQRWSTDPMHLSVLVPLFLFEYPIIIMMNDSRTIGSVTVTVIVPFLRNDATLAIPLC